MITPTITPTTITPTVAEVLRLAAAFALVTGPIGSGEALAIARDWTALPPRWRAQVAAVLAAAHALASGREDEEAAAEAWAAARCILRRARARRWNEALSVNTARRRSYRSPLGELLGVAEAYDFGHHCADYPRTARSYREAARVAELVLGELRRLAAAAIQLAADGYPTGDGVAVLRALPVPQVYARSWTAPLTISHLRAVRDGAPLPAVAI